MGTSLNAVFTQIWIAVSTYLLIAIIKKRLGLNQELYNILQVLSVCIFEKAPINQLFRNEKYNNEERPKHKQLKMFDL